MRHPYNTPVEEWHSSWLFNEVEELYCAKEDLKVGSERGFIAMSIPDRKKRGLPTNRNEAIKYVKIRRNGTVK